MRNSPVEVTHFLEYGLLSVFIYRALNHHIKNKTIYFSAALIILLIGTFDEIIQWIVPGRFWNFKDVGINVVSGALIQLAIWQVIAPKSISERIKLKSLRIFSSLFIACIIIMGMCASNSPHRVYNYSKHISFLDFLQKEEPMGEFGYRFSDPEIGVFYSRMHRNNLQKMDMQRSDDYAQILNKSVDTSYGQFLKEYTPFSNPFLHELRVHIFRRNKYLKEARATTNKNNKKSSYFIAYKENLIIKKYFRKTIKKTVYAWDENTTKEAEALIEKNKVYESPVSADLFTSFSEKTMWIVISSIIIFLLTINVIFHTREKRKTSANI